MPQHPRPSSTRTTSSRRTRPLPKGWKKTKARILRRDAGICHVCKHPGADQVDHVVPASRGGGDEDSNLAAIHSLCPVCDRRCHPEKTGREASGGPRRRPAEPHPGLPG